MAKGTLFVFVLHKPAGGTGVAFLVPAHWCTRLSSSSWFLNLPGQYVFSSKTAPNEQLLFLPDIVPEVHSTFITAVCKWSKANKGLKSFNMLCPIKPNLQNCPGGKEDIGVYPCTRRPLLTVRIPRKLWELCFQLGLVAWHDWKALKELRRTELICGVYCKATSDCCRNFLIRKKCSLSGPWHKGFCLNDLIFFKVGEKIKEAHISSSV